MAANKVFLNNEPIIDLTGDTVTPEVVVEGFKFHQSDGTIAVGTRSPYGGEYQPTGTIKVNYNKDGVYVRDFERADIDVAPKYFDEGTQENPALIKYGQTFHFFREGTEQIPNSDGDYQYRALKNVWVKTEPLTEKRIISSATIKSSNEAEAITNPIDAETAKEIILKLQKKAITVVPTQGGTIFKAQEVSFDNASYAGLASVEVWVNTSNLWTKPNINSVLTLTKNNEEKSTEGYYYVRANIAEYNGGSTISALKY